MSFEGYNDYQKSRCFKLFAIMDTLVILFNPYMHI